MTAVAILLAISWRKWPDPIVDFGREVYVPWQITEGTVIYKEMHALFGPLSPYFNAAIFWIFGPGVMHLVTVNLILYAGILAMIYFIVRVGWGRAAAFIGSLVFIMVFSFSQYVGIGNYTFAAPYAHETTHGFFIILAIVVTWIQWIRRPRPWLVALAGILWGLCSLLKVELTFTATLVTAIAGILAWFRLRKDLSEVRPVLQAAIWTACAITPLITATGVLYATGRFEISEAFYWAAHSVTSVHSHFGIVKDPAQMQLLGISNPLQNLTTLLLTGSLSVAAALGLAFLLRWIGTHHSALMWLAAACSGLAGIYLSSRLPFLESAKIFPVWLLTTAAVLVFHDLRKLDGPTLAARALLLAAACGLIARMALNPRIYHYGYYQASLAGIITVVAAWKLVPELIRLAAPARPAYLTAVAAFVAATVWHLGSFSSAIYSKKNQPIGTGADKFYGFDVNVNPSTFLMEDARRTLAAVPPFNTLLVIPEGVTLNYLLRKKTPSFAYMFHPVWLKSIDRIMDEIRQTPPDYVLIISRDMREHGIPRFGDSPEHGSALLSWVDWNCSLLSHSGGDPLDFNQQGAAVFRRKDL